ncbi:hypothetical protein TRM7557_03389 [Tritonibacter multivorans]|uniref:DUF2155 domain-containing protein n=1 Tax=Tritonibacter multivorans TaxID=928856 RepID=A0A0P1GXL7_9RHOB|nr:hypothetical protein TRM7557_03389 [Tritonibacter multivorans]SFC34147.1 hypothetical protein SAMN04488049_102225 [Tritonibacter multivorans]
MIQTLARSAIAIGAALLAPVVMSPAHAQSITVEELDPLGDGQDDGARLTTLQPAQSVEQGRADSGALGELRALDKVNGHTQTSELPVGGSAQMFGVLVTLHECRYPADNPTGDAYGFVTIRNPQSGAVKFQGWMVASSPALNALDDRRYDVWLLRCKSA